MSKISKYFKVLNGSVNSDSKNNSDSPYKNALNEIKAINLNSSNESDDFRTPKPFQNYKPKFLPEKTNTRKPSARKALIKPKKASPVTKVGTAKIDCNLEHLHMAIALSKSLQDESGNQKDESLNNSSSDEAKVSLLDRLQQYKFKSGRSGKQAVNRATSVDFKRNKSKFRYIRPILLLRTQEDREKLITNKISLILSENTISKPTKIRAEENLHSKELQSYYCCARDIFKKSGYSKDSTLKDFYVDALRIDRTSTKCGSSLKNWHEIPGRSISPTPRTINPELETGRCDSPNLFDSEDEELQQCTITTFQNVPVYNSTVNKETLISSSPECLENESDMPEANKLSQSTASCFDNNSYRDSSTSEEVFTNDNGICVFENFSQPNFIIDLSLSSNDDESNDKKSEPKSLKTGVSETFGKIVSLVSNDDTIDYVYKLLDEEAEKRLRNKGPVKIVNEHEDLYDKEINLSCINSSTGTPSDKSFQYSETSDRRLDLDVSKSSKNSIQPQVNFSIRKSLSFNSTNSDESIYISDDEVNYSCLHSTPSRARSLSKKGSFYSLSDSDSSDSCDSVIEEPCKKQLSSLSPIAKAMDVSLKQVVNCDDLYKNVEEEAKDIESTVLHDKDQVKNVDSEVANNDPSTPKMQVLVKNSNVTPMANYSEMNTPKIVKELEKFGLKPLKRQRGVQLLKYIYESTHPLVDTEHCNTEESEHQSRKKRKIGTTETAECNLAQTSTISKEPSSRSLVSTGRSILGPNEELIFERKQSKSISSCMVPLQIAWFNLVASDECIENSILLYEPLQLEDLYKKLKSFGYKYHIQDLLTFLDRKCITVRIDHTSRQRNKFHKKSKKNVQI